MHYMTPQALYIALHYKTPQALHITKRRRRSKLHAAAGASL